MTSHLPDARRWGSGYADGNKNALEHGRYSVEATANQWGRIILLGQLHLILTCRESRSAPRSKTPEIASPACTFG
jgi:hypothetical protein